MCEVSRKGVPQSLIVPDCEAVWLLHALSGRWCKETESRNQGGQKLKGLKQETEYKRDKKEREAGIWLGISHHGGEIKLQSFPAASSKNWPLVFRHHFFQMCALPLNSWQEGFLPRAENVKH